MSKEKQVYLVTYNACYDEPDNATTEGCIVATDYEDANKKFLKWLDKHNAERVHAEESEEGEDEFDLDEINILDYE